MWEVREDEKEIKCFIPWHEVCKLNKKFYFNFKYNLYYIILLPKNPLPPYFAIAQKYKETSKERRFKVSKIFHKPFDFYETKIAFITDIISPITHIKPNNNNFIINIPKRFIGITTDDKTWCFLYTNSLNIKLNTFVKFALVSTRYKDGKKSFSGFILEKMTFDEGLQEIQKHMEVREFFKNIEKKKYNKGVEL